jgi:hypothetical protein
VNQVIHCQVIGACLLLSSCGAPPGPSAEREPASNVIGDPLMQSLDKARSVEDLSGSRKGGLDEAIDDAN